MSPPCPERGPEAGGLSQGPKPAPPAIAGARAGPADTVTNTLKGRFLRMASSKGREIPENARDPRQRCTRYSPGSPVARLQAPPGAPGWYRFYPVQPAPGIGNLQLAPAPPYMLVLIPVRLDSKCDMCRYELGKVRAVPEGPGWPAGHQARARSARRREAAGRRSRRGRSPPRAWGTSPGGGGGRGEARGGLGRFNLASLSVTFPV